MPESHNFSLGWWESLQACGIEERTWLRSWHTWSEILVLVSVCFRFFLFTMGTMINVLPISPRFVEKRSKWE